MTRRIITIVLIAIATAACTPQQIAGWVAWHDTDPAAAEAYLERPDIHALIVDHAADANAPAERVGRCAEWYTTALAAGFTDDQWPTVRTIMYRESRCQPTAHNRSGATGLMQIMPMWADDCGGARADLYDGAFNLGCARHILDAQGWSAWAT